MGKDEKKIELGVLVGLGTQINSKQSMQQRPTIKGDMPLSFAHLRSILSVVLVSKAQKQ